MRYAVVLLVVSLVIVSSLAAQETTGGLQGAVADKVGNPITGAVVEAKGPFGTVSTKSNTEGEYRFPRLAPGNYLVSASFEGYPTVESDPTRIVLGESATVDFTLRRESFSEEIFVYSDTVTIDFTENQTATNIHQYEIDYLPRGRDYTDVVTFAPGTVLNHQGGGIMIDGASGLENRYIIDGLDTTDPVQGDPGVPLRAEFIEEVQVKSAGYMAEFGGSTGGVINVVSRTGSNEFHGSLFVDIEENSWNGAARQEIEFHLNDPGASLVTYDKDDEVRYDPGFSLGGPILRGRFWFFASYLPGLRTTKRTINWVDHPPDVYRQNYRFDYGSFNLTANVSSALLIKAGLNVSPNTREGSLPNRDGRSGLPGQENWAPIGSKYDRETYHLSADWVVNNDLVLSGRGGLYHTNYETTGIESYDVIHQYSIYSVAGFCDRHPVVPSGACNNPGWYSDPLRTKWYRDIYERKGAALDGTWFFRGGGQHSLKAGYQTEEISNDKRAAWNAERVLYYWDRAYTTTTGDSVRGEFGVFLLNNPSTLGDVASRNQAAFVQDAWQVRSNVTLNIGVRIEKEEIPNYGATGPDPAISFNWGDKVAPRLGLAWDIRNDAKWKLYGSWGKYYDVTKYAVSGLLGSGRNVGYYYTFDHPEIFLNETPSCRTGNNTIFERPDCPAGTFIEAINWLPNSADPEVWEELGFPLIEPNLKPMETWEAQIGVDHQLTMNIQIGARFVHKEIVRTIEDVGILLPGIGEIYVIGNPGEGITIDVSDLPYAKPVREYDALELVLDKRFSDNWSLRAYFTLSRLWGNYSGLANSDEVNVVGNPLNPIGSGGRRSPNVSRLYDLPGSMYDQNGDFVYGRLATDRTHQLGAQFLYSIPFGLNVGVNQYIGSGTLISTKGSILGGDFYPYGRGDLGETPWITQTDLSLFYTLTLGRGLNFTVGLTVLNLFDEDTPTRKWPHVQTQNLGVTNEDFLTGFNYAEELAALGPAALDSRFGMWDTFQLPRELRLTLKFEF